MYYGFVGIAVVMFGLQFFNILKSDNIRRIITGLLGGFSLTYIYYYFIMLIVKGIFMLF